MNSHLPPISQIIQITPDMVGIAGKVKTNSKVMFSYGLLHMDTLVSAGQLCVDTRYMGRDLEVSMLSIRLDDDDDDKGPNCDLKAKRITNFIEK